MGSIKKSPRPTDQDLSKNWFGWATLMRRALYDLRSLYVCVQDELSVIEQYANAKVGGDLVDPEGEAEVAKRLDEALRLLEVATVVVRRPRRLVRP